jgi:hypothetical protein
LVFEILCFKIAVQKKSDWFKSAENGQPRFIATSDSVASGGREKVDAAEELRVFDYCFRTPDKRCLSKHCGFVDVIQPGVPMERQSEGGRP